MCHAVCRIQLRTLTPKLFHGACKVRTDAGLLNVAAAAAAAAASVSVGRELLMLQGATDGRVIHSLSNTSANCCPTSRVSPQSTNSSIICFSARNMAAK